MSCIAEWLEIVSSWQKGNSSLQAIEQQIHYAPDLTSFLHLLLAQLENCESIASAFDVMPVVCQLLGRLCAFPALFSHPGFCPSLLQCILWFDKADPSSAIERKAKSWAIRQLQNTVCYLDADFSNTTLQALGFTQEDYNTEVVQSVVGQFYKTESGKESSDYVETSVNICRVCLEHAHLPRLQDLFHLLLGRLCEEQPRSLLVHKLLIDTTVTQKNAYTGTCSVVFSKKGLQLLWKSHLPSLEQEVLALVRSFSKVWTHGRLAAWEIITSRPLVETCAEDATILFIVFRILQQLLHQSNSSQLVNLINMLTRGIQKYHYQSTFAPSLCVIFPTSLHPLLQVLKNNPAGLSDATSEKFIVNISRYLMELQDSPTKTEGLWFLLMMFTDWSNFAARIALFGSDQGAITEVARSLRGLINKCSLNMTDVKCIISLVNNDHPTILPAIHQLLLTFILHARNGHLISSDVLEMVAGGRNCFSTLHCLLEELESLLPGWTERKPSHEQIQQIVVMLRDSHQVQNGQDLPPSAFNTRKILSQRYQEMEGKLQALWN